MCPVQMELPHTKLNGYIMFYPIGGILTDNEKKACFDAIQALIKPILNVKAIDTLDLHYKIFAIGHGLDMSIEVSHIR